MKKAIEILDSIQEVHCTEYANEKIDEAINELKKLENRSCDNCKYWHSKKIDHPNWRECNNKDNPYLYADTHFEFYCNKWENKA